MFEVKKLDVDNIQNSLQTFLSACDAEGIINNRSAKAMKFNTFPGAAWWGGFDGEKLFSVSGAYPCDQFGDLYWRVLFRSATLNSYRCRAGSFSKDLNHDFCYGSLLPLQKKYAYSMGAKKLFFSTNSGGESGTKSSEKVNEFVQKVLLPLKQVRLLHKDVSYHHCRQNIWEVL